MAKIAIPQAKNVVRKSAEARPAQARPTAAVRTLSAATQAQIEKLAYQFYVDRGYQDGFHDQDWLRAEAIVLSRSRS